MSQLLGHFLPVVLTSPAIALHRDFPNLSNENVRRLAVFGRAATQLVHVKRIHSQLLWNDLEIENPVFSQLRSIERELILATEEMKQELLDIIYGTILWVEVENNSSSPIWVKQGSGSNTPVLVPANGGKYIGPIDGFCAPHLRLNQVFKVKSLDSPPLSFLFSLGVSLNDSRIELKWLWESSITYAIINHLGGGGWKERSFFGTDNSWDELFNKCRSQSNPVEEPGIDHEPRDHDPPEAPEPEPSEPEPPEPEPPEPEPPEPGPPEPDPVDPPDPSWPSV